MTLPVLEQDKSGESVPAICSVDALSNHRADQGIRVIQPAGSNVPSTIDGFFGR
jgi:hypothetical protein